MFGGGWVLDEASLFLGLTYERVRKVYLFILLIERVTRWTASWVSPIPWVRQIVKAIERSHVDVIVGGGWSYIYVI